MHHVIKMSFTKPSQCATRMLFPLTIQILHNDPSKYGCSPTIFTFADLHPRQSSIMGISPLFTFAKSSEKVVVLVTACYSSKRRE